MKRYFVWGAIIAVIIILTIFFRLKGNDFLKEREANWEANITDTIPDEYLKIFNSQQVNQLKALSTIYNNHENPACVLEYNEVYDVIVFKKKIDFSIEKLEDLLKISRPLKFNAINTRIYRVLEGFVNLRFSVDSNRSPLDSVTVTMSHEGTIVKEASDEKTLACVIGNCVRFNLFYRQEQDPDISIELSNQLFGRRTSNIGLLLKQVENAVFFIFILPRSGDVEPITKDFLQKIIK